MIFGLYYNTPLIDGCRGSEMVRRFSQFMLERLGVEKAEAARSTGDRRLRVTLIARQTRFRRIVNEAELVAALEETGLYKVTVARFSPQVPFISQLSLTAGTDILAGLHGAGLTHLLFLPDWAEVVEIYNCDDTHCYQDLARLVQLAQAKLSKDRHNLPYWSSLTTFLKLFCHVLNLFCAKIARSGLHHSRMGGRGPADQSRGPWG